MAGQFRVRARLGRLAVVGVGQDCGCGLGGDEGDVLVFVDDDLLEQGAVERAAFSRFASGVEITEVGQDFEDVIEPVVGVAVGGREAVEPMNRPRFDAAAV